MVSLLKKQGTVALCSFCVIVALWGSVLGIRTAVYQRRYAKQLTRLETVRGMVSSLRSERNLSLSGLRLRQNTLRRLEQEVATQDMLLKRNRREIQDIRQNISAFESRFRSSEIPAGSYSHYRMLLSHYGDAVRRNHSLVDAYNLSVEDYNYAVGSSRQEFQEYRKKTAAYNEAVQEANRLSLEVGGLKLYESVPAENGAR